MSSWLGGSLSSLTGQLSNLTKDILTEGTEEVSDPATELSLAREKLQQLDGLLSAQRQENERLKRVNRELEEKAEGSELQINTISREYRAVLEEKEREVNNLKHQNQEFLEQQARAATFSSPSSQAYSKEHEGWDSLNFDGEHGDWDFDDSIRLQRENNSLRSELHHWKSVAAQLGQNVGQNSQSQADGADLLDLQHKVKSLEAKLQQKAEELQHQAASLHEHHRDKMAALKVRHQEEISNFQAEVASLEQRLADARDGTSGSQHSGSTNLPESERAHSLPGSTEDSTLTARLQAALRDKKKTEDGREHLESTLDELQREVEDLQAKNEALESSVGKAQELSAALEESESARLSLQQELTEVRTELVRAKLRLLDQLDANHADAQNVLSDLRELRENMGTDAAQRRDDMWAERRTIVNQLFRVGQQQKQATQSLQVAQKEQAEAMANAEATLEKLGDGDGPQNLTKEIFASLEKENLLLQEEILKLREQQVLLEKAASTASAQRGALQGKNMALREKLRNFTDEEEEEEDTDDTQDADISSENSATVSVQNAALHVSQAEIEEELKSLRAQLKQQTSELAEAELERADWDMEREALEDVVTGLRSKTQEQEEEIKSLKSGSSSYPKEKVVESAASDSKMANLEAELATLKEDKTELENAIEELDTQHNQALEQLIGQRDELSAKLAECNTQISSQQAQIQQLNEVVTRLQEEAAAKPEEERKSSVMEAEVADLKEKLQKGGLVINDLHMDKQELQEELKKAKEEVTLKVAKVKEIREENSRLLAEKKSLESKLEDMEGRLQEAEEELEQWERRNEESQVEKLHSGAVRDEECAKLKLQVEALVEEKQTFSQKLLSGIGGGLVDASDLASVEDPTLRNILEQEVKARQQVEKDHELIEELKQQVQKLYDNKQVLKREVSDLQAFKESTIEKLMDVEGELQDARFQVNSVKAEKDKLLETIEEREKTMEEIKSKLSDVEQDKAKTIEQSEKLAEQLESQQKHFNSFTQELKQSQEMSAESLQAEHQQLLDSHRELNLELDQLKAAAKGKSELEAALMVKTQENTELKNRAATLGEELTSVLTHISSLESVCQQKDREITELQQRMSQFDTDLNEIEESVSIAEEKHQQEVVEKEETLSKIKEQRDGFERSLSQVSLELEHAVQAKKVLERSLSSQNQADVAPSATVSSQQMSDIKLAQQVHVSSIDLEGEDNLREAVSKLETELLLRNSVIEQLERDLQMAQDMVHRQEIGISDLNDKSAENLQLLEKSQEQVSRQQSTIAVMRQTARDKDIMLEEIQNKLSLLIPTLSEFQMQKLQGSVGGTAVPALEYQDIKAIEFNRPALVDGETFEARTVNQSYQENSLVIGEVKDAATEFEDDIDSGVSEHERLVLLEKDINTLKERLKEKDTVVTELQKSNTSLLTLLEKGSGGQGLVDQVSAHKLEAELRGLRVEKEQMVAVMTEKSRENSSLKSEVHRLMEVVSAGQSAMAKLQEDNQTLQQQHHQQGLAKGHVSDADDDDMRREALANMARLVRDRETEIEALTQKNQTLLAVLQADGGAADSQAEGSGSRVASLLQEKEQLSQQVATMMAEREQLVACITQKHSEALAYHGEAQRLIGVLKEVTVAREKAEADYAALVPSFEDKSQALVSVQDELIQYKQRLSDLEVRHGELIHRSSSVDSKAGSEGPSPELASLEEELACLRSSELQLSSSLSQREEKVHTLSQHVKVLEEKIIQRETECAHLRKQVENTKFQLTGLMSEIADVRAERDGVQQRLKQQDVESSSLREQFSQLSTECESKDTELSTLREQVSTLTALLEQGKQSSDSSNSISGNSTDADRDGQLSRLVREHENLAAQAMQLQQEKGHYAVMAEHKVRECQQLQAEVDHCKEKELKLNKELQRLREHLIEIEDGYTKEALESEEREKNLRNRLAVIEEQLSSSSSQIELAGMESSRQIESLQVQVHHASAQRDAAYSQVASSQEQVRQLSQSLANLQLVLEQFQREKDISVAAETERLQTMCQTLKDQVAQQKKELEATRADLADALEGLEAANRLSEQLDRKEEALAALKEEVQLREQALHAAEEEIRKLNSTTEAKVDKTLMHNMVITWLTSPENKRPEIVHLIGNVLSFSPDDFRKIETAQNPGGLLSGIFRLPSSSTPPSPHSTPVKSSANSSFSQLFVSFLERESSPPPTPVRLPAEAMAAEAQSRQHQQQQHRPPAFNPFTAPRHVTHDGFAGPGGGLAKGFTPSGRIPGSSSSQHHPLMSPDSSIASSALFTPVFSTSAARSAESAILKDVLGDSR